MSQTTEATSRQIDLAEIRQRLNRRSGQAYWRGLEELSQVDAFRDSILNEFPIAGQSWQDHASRRTFLKVMGASLAMAGLTGCAKPISEKIVPYVNPPEDVIPGMPLFFASTMPFNGYGHGVIVESHEGRPTKIEGNPGHPASLGAANVFMQASVLDLYDPDRAKTVRRAEVDSTWGEFLAALRPRLEAAKGDGKGIRLLTRTMTSPTFASQLEALGKIYPNARWHEHESLGGAAMPGTNVVYDFSKADVILSLDSDFFWDLPGSVRYARQFMDGRRRDPKASPADHKMNRLYVLETTLSLTGASADHRKSVRRSDFEAVARAIAQRVGVSSISGADAPAGFKDFIEAVAEDLQKPLTDMHQNNRPAGEGRGTLVVPGRFASPAIHALAHQINQQLGNVGKTVFYTEPVEVQGAGTLEQLLDDMEADRVDTLLIVGANPAYDASGPLAARFIKALDRMSNARGAGGLWTHLTARLGSHDDETSNHCQWHLPESHYLESWGDVRAFDGTASIIQPLIIPLYESKSILEFMAFLLGDTDPDGLTIVRQYWQSQQPDNFDTNWTKWLKAGLIEKTEAKRLDNPPIGAAASSEIQAPATQPTSGWDIVFRPDYSVWDGRYVNNAWLIELPRPFTKLVWDNAALVSFRSAQELGLRDGTYVNIRHEQNGSPIEIRVPVVIVPGIPDHTLTLNLGYGQMRCGHVGFGVGYNVNEFRIPQSPHALSGATVANAQDGVTLVMTRSHHAMNALPGYMSDKENGALKPSRVEHPGDDLSRDEVANRKLVRSANLDDFLEDPHWTTRLGGAVEMRAKGLEDEIKKEPGKRRVSLNSMYPTGEEGSWDYSHGFQWAMQIDQTACIGCNACVIACQSENNIAVVGKDEVARQREMHWIRIDDWFGDQPPARKGDSNQRIEASNPLDDPQITHQPVPCMHCENAPCELVCPVGATVHSAEGLNEMVYNRCVGTRYCSNNCPYKVRRFNFFLYSDYWTASKKLQYNPDVTVRSRGVMEKCTYCIQRIQETRIAIEKMEVRYGDRVEAAKRDKDSARADQLKQQIAQQRQSMKNALQTACQQSCPTEAIIFGDKNDPQSKVTQYRNDLLDYGLLEDLTTVPRTRYLGRLRNPNPRLLGAASRVAETKALEAFDAGKNA